MNFPSSEARGRGPQIRPGTGSNQAREPTRWPPLPRQSRDRGVMHGHGSSDGTAAFAGLETLERLGLLMHGELRFAAEAGALGLGGDTAVVGAFEDTAALVPLPIERR